jgi:hypothetical protein
LQWRPSTTANRNKKETRLYKKKTTQKSWPKMM